MRVYRPTAFRPTMAWLFVASCLLLAITACTPKYVSLTKQGDQLVQKGDKEGAQKRYEAALKSSPKYAPALYRLGRLAIDKNEWENASRYLTAATVADPVMKDAWRWRGEASLRGGDLKDAGQFFRKAQELGSTDMWLSMGIYGYLSDDFDVAFEALAQAMLTPKTAEQAAIYTLKTAIASGDYAKAKAALEKAVLPEKPDAVANLWRIRAEVAYQNKEFAPALEAISKANIRGSLGFWYRDPSKGMQSRLGSIKGAVVEYIHLGAPAARVGMQAGDVITSLERKAVRSATDLSKLLEAYRKKPTLDEVLLEVFRNGEQMAFRLSPTAFYTRELIEAGAAGEMLAPPVQAPNGDMVFP